MLLGTWYTVTHCWYKWNKECSKSQAKKYYTYLIYAGFEHSVCNESLLTFCIIKYKKICFVNLNGNELMKRQFSRWLVCLRDYLRYIHLIYTSVYLYLSIYIYKIHIYIYICQLSVYGTVKHWLIFQVAHLWKRLTLMPICLGLDNIWNSKPKKRCNN